MYKQIAIDLAKHKFHVVGMDNSRKIILDQALSRSQLIHWIEELDSPCEVAMEACGSAHFWGRLFLKKGYQVCLVPPQFVKAYVIGNKTDRNDAKAILEAMNRPGLHFVPVKTEVQQDLMTCHNIRIQALRNRTALCNQIRSILYERGLIVPKSISALRDYLVKEVLTQKLMDEGMITPFCQNMFLRLYQSLKELDAGIKEQDQQLKEFFKGSEPCQKISAVKGMGVTTATSLIAAIGLGHDFKSGRQLSAWLGLVPKEHSSGGKRRLGGMTKRGSIYLRCQLIHGARAYLFSLKRRQKKMTEQAFENKLDGLDRWALSKLDSKGYNKAAVAVANKMARICWVLLNHAEAQFDPHYRMAA